MDAIFALSEPPRLYAQPLPALERAYDLPFPLRYRVGQAAADGLPLPGPLALAWARLIRQTNLRTPAQRCPDELAALFLPAYAEVFCDGIKLPPGSRPLALAYRAASSALPGSLTLTCKTVPDVLIPALPRQRLATLLNEGTRKTRRVQPVHRAQIPSAVANPMLWLLLPDSLWPRSVRETMQALQERLAQGFLVLSVGELSRRFGASAGPRQGQDPGRGPGPERRAIGIEPDPAGARLPKAQERVALFAAPAGGTITRSTPVIAWRC